MYLVHPHWLDDALAFYWVIMVFLMELMETCIVQETTHLCHHHLLEHVFRLLFTIINQIKSSTTNMKTQQIDQKIKTVEKMSARMT
jgi:TPP-dependent 2-oxoacid decarboxylase